MDGKLLGALIGAIFGCFVVIIYTSAVPQNTDVERGAALLLSLVVIIGCGFLGYKIGEGL